MSWLLHSNKELSVLWDTGNSVLLVTMANMLKNLCQDLKVNIKGWKSGTQSVACRV